MQTSKLSLSCPLCRSSEVFYSCSPSCCFNHVCGECGATFEPVTSVAGKVVTPIIPPDPLPDPSDPTVGCARCESVAVYVLPDGTLGCRDCGSLLALEITEVNAN